jgi:hypothetical protein
MVFVPFHLAIHPDVPDPVTLFEIDGVIVTVLAVPPDGVTVKLLTPPLNVYVVSVGLAQLPSPLKNLS